MSTENTYREIDELLAECLSDRATKELWDELSARAQASEEVYARMRARLEIWFSSEVAGSMHPFDSRAAYARFRRRVAAAGSAEKPRLRLWRHFYRVAAVLLLLLLPLAGYWSGKNTLRQAFTDVVVEAPMGSQTKLHLPDGTAVWLNAGSRITYSQGFGVNGRTLRLEGEGYFEVAKDEKQPFVLETKELKLRVLGTKFNFRNYPDDNEVAVSLMEGRVALRNGLLSMPEVVLLPAERVVLDKRTGKMKKSKADVHNANAWARNELFFDEDLLEDIAKRLMRSYNVRIEVADSLRNKRFYGYFKIVGGDVNDVLQTMASTGRMRYKYEKGKYVLY